MTEISINAKVQCQDGPYGKSTHIIVNPISRKVTHIVVESKHLPMQSTRLVDIERIVESTPDQISLNCTRQGLEQMEPFYSSHYVEAGEPDYVPDDVYTQADYVYMQPYVAFTPGTVTVSEKHIAPGEMDIHRGLYVEATDGRIGQVHELVVNAETWKVTDVVLRKGHLWGKKDVVLPLSDIDRVEDDIVLLKIDKKTIETRPSSPIHRASK